MWPKHQREAHQLAHLIRGACLYMPMKLVTDPLSHMHVARPRFGEIRAKMDHLTCFVPAMLALGVHAHAVTEAKAVKFLDLAEELGRTCWQMRVVFDLT